MPSSTDNPQTHKPPPGTRLTPDNAKRGMRVILVDDRWDFHRQPDLGECSFPKLGWEYTIRDVELTSAGTYGCRLMEVQGPVVRYDIGGRHEICFGLHRFKVVENARCQ